RGEIGLLRGPQNRFAQCVHGARPIQFGKSVELGFEAALQQEIAEALHQFVEVDGVRRFAYVFSVFDYFHSLALVVFFARAESPWPGLRSPEERTARLRG